MELRVLKKPQQFREVYRKGDKITGRCTVVFYYRTGSAEESAFGYVASKKVGNAVCRSRAKRLLRVAAKGIADQLRYDDLQVVLIARSGILNSKSQDVTHELETQLVRAGLIDKN